MKIHSRSLFPAGLILALGLFAASLSPAQAFFGLSIGIAPPPLPVYAQPECPGSGYIWVPGYWAWSSYSNEYYWVPGTWALAPEVGLLWTPGWWGCNDGAYYFNNGYWGSQVGFYGGINYGHGYGGYGYDGGYWRNNHFFYNSRYNDVSRIDHGYVYSRSGQARSSRVSYNGGTGGIAARPTAAEIAAGREHHVNPTSAQTALVNAAAGDSSLRYANNHGHPAVLATDRPGDFHATTTRAAADVSHRTAAESASTGDSHSAAGADHERVASEAEHKSPAATETHHATEEHSSGFFSHLTASRPAAEHSASAAGASHAPAYHEASHAPAFHAAPAHAPAAHAAGGGGGGGRADHR